MRPALDSAGHRVPRTKPTCLLHTWRPHRQRTFVLVLHLHQQQSSRNLHLQYLAKNQSTQCCQSLITQGSDHPPVLEPHMILKCTTSAQCKTNRLVVPTVKGALDPHMSNFMKDGTLSLCTSSDDIYAYVHWGWYILILSNK
jgi:hypothetical protein